MQCDEACSWIGSICGSTDNTSLSPCELDKLLMVANNLRVGSMRLASDHPLFTRLHLTLCADIVSDGRSQLLSLNLLSRLALNRENIEPIQRLMDECSAQVESILRLHNIEDGGGHGDVLLIMLCLSNLALRGTDLLELYDGNLQGAIGAIHALLRILCAEAPDTRNTFYTMDVFVAVCRLSWELSSWRSYASAARISRTDSPMNEIAVGFEGFSAQLNRSLLSHPIFDHCGVVLCRWFEHIERNEEVGLIGQLMPRFQSALTNLLSLISNTILYTTQYTAQLKKHLSNRTILVSNVVLPYLLFLTDAMERRTAESPQDKKALMLIVRVTSLLMFNIRSFRLWTERYPMLGARLVSNAVMWDDDESRVEYIALVVRLIVNAEMRDSVNTALQVHSRLSEKHKSWLAVRLGNPRERMYPINLFCEVYVMLRPVFLMSQVEPLTLPFRPAKQSVAPTTRELQLRQQQSRIHRNKSRTTRKRENIRTRYQKLKARREQFTAQRDEPHEPRELTAAVCDSALERINEGEDDATREEDEDAAMEVCSESDECIEMTDMSAPRAPETLEVVTDECNRTEPCVAEESRPFDLSAWRGEAPAGVPQRYLCALSNKVMSVPVITPYGDTFEKATILEFLKVSRNRCPISGEDLYANDLVVDHVLKRELDVVRYNYI